MPSPIDRQIRQIANGRCEYCRLPESRSVLPHVLDHIIAKQHGGETVTENLALCCGSYNRHKGPNIAGVDPHTKLVSRLFNPRLDVWEDHFKYEQHFLVGLTEIGRATIVVLAINQPSRVAARAKIFP